MEHFALDLCRYRTDSTCRTWELPPWGTPFSKFVLPLFLRAGGYYKPIGTAFWVGPKVQLILTAVHNVNVALQNESHLERLIASGDLPKSAHLRASDLYVLDQDNPSDADGNFTLTPVPSIQSGLPGDVAIGHPRFRSGRPIVSLPLTFDPPRIREKVWSLGYIDFGNEIGVPIESVEQGKFDWARSYSHRLVVTEGIVESIFIQRFDRGYLRGPCFIFDNAITHGQSGGPVINSTGKIVGLNSGDVSIRYGKSASAASMLYPNLLMDIHLKLNEAPLNLSVTRSLFDLVRTGAIASDSSHAHVAFHALDQSERPVVGPLISAEDQQHIFEDFQGYLDKRPALPLKTDQIKNI